MSGIVLDWRRHKFHLATPRADITQVYAEKNLELAIQVARETG